MTGIEQLVLKGNFPWTLRNSKPDHASLQPASQCARIDYPKPDGKLTFDKLSSVFISNTNHDENEPVHLTLKDPAVPVQVNLAKYGGPESRYCPAGVYEFVKDDHGDDRLQINAQNCVHCKTCDIRTPPRTSSGSPQAAKARLQRHVSMAERALLIGCGDLGLRARAAAGPGRGNPCPAAPAARRRRGRHRLAARRHLRPDGIPVLPAGITRLILLPAPARATKPSIAACSSTGCAMLAALDASHLQRIVFVSSSAVYGEHRGGWVDEDTARAARLQRPHPAGSRGIAGSPTRIRHGAATGRPVWPGPAAADRAAARGPGRRARRAPHWANRIHR